jgi:hypothetical protein
MIALLNKKMIVSQSIVPDEPNRMFQKSEIEWVRQSLSNCLVKILNFDETHRCIIN